MVVKLGGCQSAPLQFESSVIPNGSQTLTRKDMTTPEFESSVILNNGEDEYINADNEETAAETCRCFFC